MAEIELSMGTKVPSLGSDPQWTAVLAGPKRRAGEIGVD
jgi:hypothetical protein